MTKPIARDQIYRRRRFDAEIIELCVRWYITYRLSYRDLAAMMAERGIIGFRCIKGAIVQSWLSSWHCVPLKARARRIAKEPVSGSETAIPRSLERREECG